MPTHKTTRGSAIHVRRRGLCRASPRCMDSVVYPSPLIDIIVDQRTYECIHHVRASNKINERGSSTYKALRLIPPPRSLPRPATAPSSHHRTSLFHRLSRRYDRQLSRQLNASFTIRASPKGRAIHFNAWTSTLEQLEVGIDGHSL